MAKLSMASGGADFLELKQTLSTWRSARIVQQVPESDTCLWVDRGGLARSTVDLLSLTPFHGCVEIWFGVQP